MSWSSVSSTSGPKTTKVHRRQQNLNMVGLTVLPRLKTSSERIVVETEPEVTPTTGKVVLLEGRGPEVQSHDLGLRILS